MTRYRLTYGDEEGFKVIDQDTGKDVYGGSFIACYERLEKLVLKDLEAKRKELRKE
jgi:hypothetical protein